MKNSFLVCLIASILLYCTSFAQKPANNFTKQWQVIDSLYNKERLPKSALAEVKTLYGEALREKNEPQIIKALIYELEITSELNDNDEEVYYSQIPKLHLEIRKASNLPQKSLLQVLLAKQYQNIYEQNRWSVRNRHPSNDSTSDIKLWSASRFYQVIDSLYKEALSPAAALKKTTISSYAPVIIPGNVGTAIQKDLYDLLLRAALEYYQWNDTGLLNSMEKDIPETAFLPAKTFVQQTFDTTNTSANAANILNYYQQLLLHHNNDDTPAAFLDIDIDRIKWIYSNSKLKQKDSLYLNVLKTITTAYTNEPAAAEAWYSIAAYYADRATRYQPLGDTSYRYDYNIAKKIIDEQLSRKTSESEGQYHMQQLRSQITAAGLITTAEKVNIPGKPFRLHVSYKNTPVMYARILRYKASLNKPLLEDLSNTEITDSLLKLRAFKAFTQSLPATNDYQRHTTEIKIDALPIGRYILIASTDSTFKKVSEQLCIQPFDVSNISYVNDNSNNYFALHRETGKPLAGCNIHVTPKTWDSRSGSYKKQDARILNANENGYFKLENISGYAETMLIYNNDTLVLENNYYYNTSSYTPDQKKENVMVHFFTDRSIYRPGQTIFLKGIAITERGRKTPPQVRHAGDSIKVFIYNNAATAIDSLTVTTNSYGSFAGQFLLPAQLLTGSYSITARSLQHNSRSVSYNGATYIQVEEYKRPKFYVTFDTLAGSYRLHDTIILTGKAKAYAGNTIADAKVTYSVTRNANYPYPWLFRDSRIPYSASTTLTNGVVSTDSQGSFTVKFAATPDMDIAPTLRPVFTFTATAAVTDLSGETRESNTSISAGYNALQIALNIPLSTGIKDFTHITASVKNLSGKDIPAPVTLTVSPIEAPARLIRQRYWEQPDQFVMSYNEYISHFPNDEYKDESNYQSWPKKESVINTTFFSNEKKGYAIGKTLTAGWYIVEAKVIDNNGDTLKDQKYIELTDKNAKNLPYPFYQWNNTADEQYYIPGDTLRSLEGSSVEERFVIEQRKQNNEDKAQFSYHKVKKGLRESQYRIQNKDCGGFKLSSVFVFNNRIYTHYQDIKVSYPGKQLSVTYKTFRNKTTPGSKETWSVQVKNESGAAEAAELLTAMYDASLDQFQPHSWSTPAYWQASTYGALTWNGSNNFRSQYSSIPSFPQSGEELISSYQKYYNKLATTISDFYAIPAPGTPDRTITYPADQVGKVEIAKFTPPRITSDRIMVRGLASKATAAPIYIADGRQVEAADVDFDRVASVEVLKDASATAIYGARAANGVVIINSKNSKQQTPVQVRKQFNETAFFFPQLYADKQGNYTFSFTMPEAVTQWKWLSLAHSKALAFGTQQQTIATQKTLMVQMNTPRFLRQGDDITLVATISNLDTAVLKGAAKLELLNAGTMNSEDLNLGNVSGTQSFTAAAGQTTTLAFRLRVPADHQEAIIYRITAEAGNYSDGEENIIPVLPNRTLVTETMALQLRGNAVKTYRLEKLLRPQSNTQQTQSLTIEYTTNPAWQALQSLPYLAEYPYECAEQTFNRYYAHKLVQSLTQRSAIFREAFRLWQQDSTAFVNSIEKNQALKQLLLAETPWVSEAKNMREQTQRLVRLFATNTYANTNAALQQLKQLQNEDGSFSWFKGGYPDRYITNYIVTGIGKLQKLGALSIEDDAENICIKAIQYLDSRISEEYKQLLSRKADLKQDYLNTTYIQYLYARSFFKSIRFTDSAAHQFLLTQAANHWTKQNNYNKALLATVLFRNGKGDVAKDRILPSIFEYAIGNEDRGMYWKDRTTCFWHPSPIEHQSAIMLSVAEIGKAYALKNLDSAYREMRTWLILNKQTNSWGTTIATADACYVLLADSTHSNSSRTVSIQLGDTTIRSTGSQGFGYFSETLSSAQVKPGMGDIKVTTYAKEPDAANQSDVSYGAVYWQYFEDMDKITAAAGNALSVEKKLFLEKTSGKGPLLESIAQNTILNKGDKLVVQLVLKANRDMDYIQLKDMRAASMEPVNVLSGYKWSEGLGYYEANKDASTSFFIDHLRKGTYIVSYPVYLTHTGVFTAGIATVSCMYAPEFNSHSDSRKVEVK